MSPVDDGPEPAAPPPAGEACASCAVYRAAHLKKLGLATGACDFVVALAGNPNTGKSTVFNALTGLRQHTGNWPGKTVARAEGSFAYADKRYRLVDLPGTYSLLSTSPDEEIARNFLLFGQPDVTVIVVDATRLERNLNLVLQVLEITGRVVVCLNLVDEATRHGIEVDDRQLARDLGVPVVRTSARSGQGIPRLLEGIADIARGAVQARPRRLPAPPAAIREPLQAVLGHLQRRHPALPNANWVALRLLGGDDSVAHALRRGELGGTPDPASADELVAFALSQRSRLRGDLHEQLVEAVYAEASSITARCFSRPGRAARPTFDRTLDRLLTSRWLGFPVMGLLFALIFWLTISGSNVPSKLLADFLVGQGHPFLKGLVSSWPAWLSGLLVDGIYLATAWVISVMLPPMAIFFPLFTLLEDFGYLPRVAFNLDGLFRRTGAHGKQAMSMMMGFGCNAAGVISTRIIDSPRERLIAILTNNFSLCNGRWPTQILIATIFIGALAPPHLAGVVSAVAVVAVALLGIALTFLVSWALSRTVLRGEVSTFSLELPPYRPPRFWKTLYTSLIDRTLFVLWRAVVFALPAGAVIWLIANLHVGGGSLAEWLIHGLDPLGLLLGLNGIILLAYIVAIPANEIVMPTIFMLTVLVTGQAGVGQGAGVMFELDSLEAVRGLLTNGGWTLLTGVNLMLFSLLHNPCSTTLYTIYKETGSIRWAALSAIIPLALGFAVTFLVARVWMQLL